MTVTFFSNFLLHHQLPFCNSMYESLRDDFRFVATTHIPQERLDMGYKDMSHDYTYSVNSYEDEASFREAQRLADQSDIVIIGAAPQSFFTNRLDKDKLTFRYTERLFKDGKWRIFDPRVAKACYERHTKYRKNKNYYLLCASAYTAPDCKFIHAYKNKMLKWGYFPPLNKIKENNIDPVDDGNVKLLWIGRFISLKRPDYPVKCLKYLVDNGCNVSLTMIGSGELEDEIKQLAAKLGVTDKITFTGSVPTDKVAEYIQRADVFLFTSNREEGWGAVLNESMSGGCAVVASGEIGSVPFLLSNEKNGLIFNGSLTDLCRKTERLVENRDLRRKLSANALETVYNEWNPETATKRFIELSENLMRGKFEPYKSGPCSPALPE